MPIGLGLASSHAPAINAPVDQLVEHYHDMTRGLSQPPQAALETEEVLHSYIEQIHAAFSTLRGQLLAYRPDVLIMIGGDQNEMFDDSNVPNLMMYVGEEAWGYNVSRATQRTNAQAPLITLRVDVDTSRRLLDRLVVEEGFDIAFSTEQRSLGRANNGQAHAIIRPAPHLMPELDIPVVLIYENTFDAPSLPARRCYELGRALARLLRDDPRRIAIYGSGGLSHDLDGPRCGWIDEPLDRWFLERIERGEGSATTAMFRFDSTTMRSGTGETRAWITTVGAMEEMGKRATVVDYIPHHHGITGLAWAYWPADGEED